MKARSDNLYLFDILECCKKIQSYVAGMSQDDFTAKPIVQDAVVRNIEIIGEAAKCLSSEFRDANPEIMWKDIMRMRDKVVHHYFRINLEVVWQTAIQDVPQLLEQIGKIIPGDLP